jgi:hypothetical protein
MPSISSLQRKRKSNRDAYFIGLFAAIACLDEYRLSKSPDRGIELIAYKGLFKETFAGGDETCLLDPLGKWICKLPKTVWE